MFTAARPKKSAGHIRGAAVCSASAAKTAAESTAPPPAASASVESNGGAAGPLAYRLALHVPAAVSAAPPAPGADPPLEIGAVDDPQEREAEAIFAKPNCTAVFCESIEPTGTTVQMGRILDGVAEHMADFNDDRTFVVAKDRETTKEEVVRVLRETQTDVLMNYLPVGSQEASEFYAECALEAGVAFVNNIPVFIASNPEWADHFTAAGVPIIGDDIKAQLGAKELEALLDRSIKGTITSPCDSFSAVSIESASRSRERRAVTAAPKRRRAPAISSSPMSS